MFPEDQRKKRSKNSTMAQEKRGDDGEGDEDVDEELTAHTRTACGKSLASQPTKRENRWVPPPPFFLMSDTAFHLCDSKPPNPVSKKTGP